MVESDIVVVAVRSNAIFLLSVCQKGGEVKKRLCFEHQPTDVQFDPCSSSYMIICLRNGDMSLGNVDTMEEV